MHTGYYKDNSELNFCPLENEFLTKFSVDNGYKFNFIFSAYDMLHGCCDIFADTLARIFNDFKIYSLLDPTDSCLVHCYCMLFDDNKRYYIDVRGITDNFSEFISEFADFIDTTDEQELLNARLIVPYNFNTAEHNRDYMQGTDFEKKIVELSKQIISHQKEFYNPISVKKELAQDTNKKIKKIVKNKNYNTNTALDGVTEEYSSAFSNMTDDCCLDADQIGMDEEYEL